MIFFKNLLTYVQLKRPVCLLVMVACTLPQYSEAQGCGTGVFELQFIDSNSPPYTYELFQISKAPAKCIRADLYRGCFVDKAYADGLKPSLMKKENLPTNNPFIGTIANGQLLFQTLELYPKPLLLKLKTEGKTYFLVGLFLSGCNRTAHISLRQKTVVLQN